MPPDSHEYDNARHTLRIEGAHIGYPTHRVIEGMTFGVPEGRMTAIVGPNGSGKSTLLHAIARVLRPNGGRILLDGKDVHRQPTNAVARLLALLPQAPEAPEEATVWDLVGFGRFPYHGWFGPNDDDNATHIRDALETVGMLELAQRPVHTLSGGQRQRVWIAMALAQQTHFLLLDEPTTFLDIAHQLEVMDIIRGLNQRLSKTIVMVLHDLNLAARYADHMVMLKDGGIAAAGPPRKVMTPTTLRDVFAIKGRVIRDETGAPVLLPLAAAPGRGTPTPPGANVAPPNEPNPTAEDKA